MKSKSTFLLLISLVIGIISTTVYANEYVFFPDSNLTCTEGVDGTFRDSKWTVESLLCTDSNNVTTEYLSYCEGNILHRFDAPGSTFHSISNCAVDNGICETGNHGAYCTCPEGYEFGNHDCFLIEPPVEVPVPEFSGLIGVAIAGASAGYLFIRRK